MSLPFTINIYGLIIATSILVASGLISRKAKAINFVINLDNLAFYLIITGIIGARVWHVLTDFDLYQNSLIEVLYIWQGGLSIIGAILASLIFLLCYSYQTKTSFFRLADLIVFGLPFGQAIGRLANYFNQELYGLTTSLPWGIAITGQQKFHPLFFYEMVITFSFGIWVWWLAKNSDRLIGKGWLFCLYVIYYFSFRIILDYLRIFSKPPIILNMHLNQVVSLCLVVLFSIQLFKLYEKK